MLRAVFSALSSARVDSLVYVGGEQREDYAAFGYVRDDASRVDTSHRSSLLGVIAAVTHAHDTQHDAAVILGCDVPLVSPKTIQQLVESLAHAEVAVAEHDGDHWSILAIRSGLHAHLRDSFVAGERAIHRAVAGARIMRVPCSGRECTNVNDAATWRHVTDTTGVADGSRRNM